MAADIARQLGGAAARVDFLLPSEEAAQTESAVEKALEAMRRAAIEAGN